MRYLSVCSGIEAASVAWHPLGWKPVAFSEIEPFPSAVLAHRFPEVPNLGDMTNHAAWPLQPGDVDLLVGGTPCQSFSVAGLRKGLSDPRGGLMLTYLEIARRLRPRWIVWENVPGVLSSGRGRDFGSFLGALGELGYGWAYRVLDAQWVRTQRHPRAVPQRRRRVFVVGCLGDWTAAAAVLFERESVQRNPSPRGASRQGAAADAEGCAGTVSSKWAKGTGGPAGDECYNLTTGYRWQNNRIGLQEDQAVAALRASAGSSGFSEMNHPVIAQPTPFRKSKRAKSATDDESWIEADQANTLNAFDTGERDTHAVAFAQNQLGEVRIGEVTNTLNTNSNASGRNTPMVAIGTDCYNGAITGDVAATMTKASGGVCSTVPTVMQAHAVAFTPGNLARGAGASPNADVSQTLQSQQGRGSSDQHPCVARAHAFYSTGGTHGVNQHPEVSPAVKVGSGLGIPSPPAVAHAMTVRRLTPRECERLQGFPDDWTLIPWRKRDAADCPDGPRYKALGNSMAVNCMEWIGERIARMETR